MCKTLAIGLFAAGMYSLVDKTVLWNSESVISRSAMSVIVPVAVRTFHYYCGWGATIGACTAFIAAVITNATQQNQQEPKSPLLGAVVFGVIGYGVERIAKALLPIINQRIARL